MSEQVSGVIQAIRQDRKGVKINNEWYSVRNSSAFGDAAKGDTMTCTFTRNGRWINCDEQSIQITKGPKEGGFSGGKGGKGSSEFRSPDEIMRGESLKGAIEFLSMSDEYSGDYPENIEKTLRTADLFTAYTKGLIDMSQSTSAAPPPAPEPEPEPEPEPAPAPAASALSDFLGG